MSRSNKSRYGRNLKQSKDNLLRSRNHSKVRTKEKTIRIRKQRRKNNAIQGE